MNTTFLKKVCLIRFVFQMSTTVEFPTPFVGAVKLVFLVSGFFLLSLILFLLGNRKVVMDNWDTYKCSPMVIPFAEYFGHSSSETMNACMFTTFKASHHASLPPFLNILGDVSASLSSAGDMMSAMDNILGGVQSIFTTGFSKILRQIGNTTSVAQYLIIKMEVLLQRLSAMLIVVMYSLNASLQGVVAIRRDKDLLRAVDTLLSFPSF